MAQIKKHAGGGTASLVERPVDAAPAPTNKLKFTVDGQDHEMDETAFNAIAEKAFSNEVRKGQAKLRDRSKWMNEFNVKLSEAKAGKFNIQSSGDTVSAISYQPTDANYDASAHDGVGANGETAQRSTLGSIVAPRATGSTDRMASILNTYIGEGVISDRKNLLQQQQAKADADKATKLGEYNTSITNDAKSLANPSLGKIAFGADWDNEDAKKMILGKVWGKETGHVAAIDNAFKSYLDKVYDPYYNGKESDYLKEGVDIKSLRDKYSSVYDPNTKSFKTPLKNINDLYRYSDAMDSISTDSPLFNKGAYQAYLNGGAAAGTATTPGSPVVGAGPNTTPGAPGAVAAGRTVAGQEGGLFKGSDGRYFADKGLTRTLSGQWDGKYYDHGYLRIGKYAPVSNGPDGQAKYDYYHPEAGEYADGVKVDQNKFDQYLNTLAADKGRAGDYQRLLKNNQHVDQKYASDNFIDRMTNGFVGDDNIINHGEYAFKGFGAQFKPAGAVNLTSVFKDKAGKPIKGGIYGFQSGAKNHLGVPDAEMAVMTDDGYNFRGVMQKGADGKYHLFNKNPDHTLVENKDPKLRAYLDNLGDADDSQWNPQSGHDMLLNRSHFAPGQSTPTAVPRTAGNSVAQSSWRDLLKPAKYQLGGSIKKKAASFDPNQITNSDKTTYRASKISNVLKGDYEMGTQEKLEAGALLADLTGVGLALTGAGSVAAGVVGAAGTTAQLAADVKRDGLDWGDAGRAALGYGLDAASSIPGLGIGAKGVKTASTLKRASKYLLPAMGAIGASKAAGLLADVATGKKTLTDLNMDDMRTLTNGIHGAMGASRTINNRVALKRGTESTLKLKNGSVNLDEGEVSALGKLKGDAQIAKAKEIVAAKLGKDVGEVNLSDVKDGLKSKTWNRLPFTAEGKVKEVVDINTSATGLKLKDINDYQGNGLKDKYMRWAIDKAAVRNPGLAYDLTDAPNGQRASKWGALGDYTRKNVVGDGPSNAYGPSNIVGPSSQYGEFSVSGASSRVGESSILGANSPWAAPGPYTPYNVSGMYSKVEGQIPTRLALPQGIAPTQGPALPLGPAGGANLGVSFNAAKRRIRLSPSGEMKDLTKPKYRVNGDSSPTPPKPRIKIKGDIEGPTSRFDYDSNNSPVSVSPRRALPAGRIQQAGPAIALPAEKVQDLNGNYVEAGGFTPYNVNGIHSSILMSPTRALQRGALTMNQASIEPSTRSIYRGGEEPKINKTSEKGKSSTKSTSSKKAAATRKFNKVNKDAKKGDQLKFYQFGGTLATMGAALPKLTNKIPALNTLFNYTAPTEKPYQPLLKFNGSVASTPTATTTGVAGPSTNLGLATSGTGNWMQKVKGYLSGVNKNDLSEFGRALATRAVNQRIDTRVEAPLATAPQEVSVPIQGDLLTKSAFYNRAADAKANAGAPLTSDGALFTAQNLSGERQANELRMQGDMANAQAIEKSRAMSLQNTMQNNSVRSEVANRNIATLANAKQAERSANNQKIGLVAQPLLSFWENKNAENLRKEASDNQIDRQIGLSSLSSTVTDMKAPLNKRATDLYYKSLDTSLTEDQRKVFSDQYEAVQRQIEQLGIASRNHALQMTKDKNYVAPADYYSKYTKPLFAEGGMIKAINAANKDAYKERLRTVRADMKDDKQTNILTLKEIQKLINKALTGK